MYTDSAAIAIGIFAIIFSVGAGLVTAAAVVQSYIGALDRRIAYLDRKINQILDELGIDKGRELSIAGLSTSGVPLTEPRLSSDAGESVEGHLRQGNKIQAIRLYRELNSSAGLKEAKDAVEELARSMGLEQIPWRY